MIWCLIPWLNDTYFARHMADLLLQYDVINVFSLGLVSWYCINAFVNRNPPIIPPILVQKE